MIATCLIDCGQYLACLFFVPNVMKLNAISLVLASSLMFCSAWLFAEPMEKIILPDMGDSTGTLITPTEERQFGESFYRSLHAQVEINQDPEIQQYIESIGQKLTVNSDNPGHPYHFFVVLENDINAFAGPGGYIGVNSGLILTTEAESELAAVMSHEIAHVTQRHLYRAYEASSRMSIPSTAAMLAAILLGTQSPAMGQAALIAIQAGNVQFQIDFTRENEAEADRVGMQTLAASQYDPRSMPTFFERLQQSSRYAGQNVPEFLRTHPVTTSRISDTRGRADAYPYKQYSDSLNYLLTKAKLRVLTDKNNAETLKFFQISAKQGTLEQRTVARYGLALIALQTQQFKDAEQGFQQLIKEYPDQPQYQTALARTALESRDYSLALSRYKALTEQYPENEAIRLEYMSSLLKTGKAEQVKNMLFSLSPNMQRQPVYLELLAQVYSDLKQPAESHRYLAEYYFVTGQTRDAIAQIKLAQNSKGLNPELSALIDDRLRFFMMEMAEAKRNQ